jgi:type III restriction enzyme
MKLLNLEYREEALKQLKSYFFKMLNKEFHRQILAFQAPTGSGKTVTMACFLRDVVNELPTHFEIENRNVTYIWIAPNTLHLQSYNSLSLFFSETRDIRTLSIEDITDDCLKPNEMLFLNWQTINRDDTLFMREGEDGKSFQNILNQTLLNETQIVLIIDEEHLMAGGKTAEKAEAILRRMRPKIEIRISATLSDVSLRSKYKVDIDREDVVKAEMIKKGVHLNPAVRADEQAGRDADLVLLQKAIDKRIELEELYKSAETSIRPLLLIQLPSDTAKISSEDTRIRELVVNQLDVLGITEKNGKLAVWLSGEKTNLEDISKPDNMVEVLLFKQAIALGWDCPRASVLLIYREIQNERFSVQTMGRILRMPEQKHYANDALNYGYVYTNLNKDLIEIIPEEADYITENKAERNDVIYQSVALKSYYIQKEIIRNRIGLHFKEALFRAAEQLFNVKIGSVSGESFYHTNIAAMVQAGIIMDVEEIEISIPTDVNIDVTRVGATIAEHSERFAKTTYQLEQLFNRYCLASCGDYQKDASWERIKYHTQLLFEEYLGIYGSDVFKIVLYNQNPRFNDLYNLAREIYGQIMVAKATNSSSEVKENDKPWDVPEFKYYSENHKKFVEAKIHALQPMFARERSDKKLFDSANEHQFVQLLVENEVAHIQWWYKNGASGKEDFAIPYEKEDGSLSLFYVDFVILFKNGTLGLFDPKTIDSNPDNERKHNALVNYISELNGSGRKAIGGIVIPKDGSWRYSNFIIENDTNLEGWEFFNPATINAN